MTTPAAATAAETISAAPTRVLLTALLLVACFQAAAAQAPPSGTLYVGAGPGSSGGDLGWGVGQIGLQLEKPLKVGLDATLHAAAIVVGAACTGDCDIVGYIAEAGVSRVFGQRLIAPFGGVSTGLYELEGYGVAVSASAGLQIGRRSGVRIGIRAQMLSSDDFVALPGFIGLRLAFR